MTTRNERRFWGAVGGMLALSLACNNAMLAPDRAAPAPPPITSAALQPTLEQAQVQAYLAEIEARQTLNAVYAQRTAVADMQQIRAAQEAREATATAAAGRATATAESWRMTIEASQAYGTATAEAYRVTATAEAVHFAHATTATAVAWSVNATATAEALRAAATIRAAEAERAQLALERERMVYPLRAFGPWVLGIIIIGALLGFATWLARQLGPRIRAVPRDLRGDAKILVFSDGKGGTMILDPDRAFGPATLLVDGQVTQPTLAAPEYQERVTARDQAVDLAHRGLPPETPRHRLIPPGRIASMLPAAPESPAPGTPELQIIQPEQVRTWLNEVNPKALTAAIEGEIIEEEDKP